MFDRIIEKEFYTETEAAHAFRQFMLGINYCHSKGIVHRDLKPENFLYETKDADSDVKIIDFGLSKIFKPGGNNAVNKMTTRAGTVSISFFISLLLNLVIRLLFIINFHYSLTIFHQRFQPVLMMKSAIFGLPDVFYIPCFVDIQPSVETMIKKFLDWLLKVNLTLMGKSGMTFQKKPKT